MNCYFKKASPIVEVSFLLMNGLILLQHQESSMEGTIEVDLENLLGDPGPIKLRDLHFSNVNFIFLNNVKSFKKYYLF